MLRVKGEHAVELLEWTAPQLAMAVHRIATEISLKESQENINQIGKPKHPYMGSSYTDKFAVDKKFKPFGLVTGVEAYKGQDAREVGMKAGEQWTQAKYNELNQRYQDQTLEQLRSLAKKDEPFFLQYWPMIPINLARSDRTQFKTQNGGTIIESMQQLDGWVGDILDELDTLGMGTRNPATTICIQSPGSKKI